MLTPAATEALSAGRLRSARLAVLAYFAVLGIASGDWLARIPAIKHGLHLSDGRLGVALLAAPVGQVAVALLGGPVLDRVGSRVPTVVGGVAVALVPVSFGVAAGQLALMVGLLGFGVVNGLLDIAMNSQAVHVERGSGRPLMTSFHACYSFGALAGGLIGGAFAWAGAALAVNFAAVGVPLAALALPAGRWLLADGRPVAGPAAAPARAAEPAPRSRRGGTRVSPLLVVCLLAFCSLLGEGAADSWNAVYLHDNLGSSAGVAAMGYVAFALTMAVGRLAGDRLAFRFGPVALVRGGGLVAASGLAGALLSPGIAGTLAGFAVYGAGLSCTFPQLVSAAGRIRPDRPAGAIARVAGTGYVGLLCGPVLIGSAASAAGLSAALTLPVLLSLCIAAGAGFACAPARRPGAALIG